ncbi:MAG: DUF1285 domain-containing protein [Pseudomonadales bacterium]
MSKLNSLFDELIAMGANRALPPVSSWHPAHTGTIDIRIAADGSWFHEGDPIRRDGLVRLFASILRRDPEGFCLVTPAERLFITVEDAPFVAVDMETRGEDRSQDVLFVTNVGDIVPLDATHPLRMGGTAASPKPYLAVRSGLEARLTRPVFYRLVELGQVDGEGSGVETLQVWSAGERFTLGTL